MVGNCDTGSSCAYTNSLSWKNPDTPLAVEVNPRSVFERLFGTVDPSLSGRLRARRALYRKSMLDQTRESTQQLELDLGPGRPPQDGRISDRCPRSGSSALTAAEKDPSRRRSKSPPAFRSSIAEYVKLMFDLQAIAFQSDLTRV